MDRDELLKSLMSYMDSKDGKGDKPEPKKEPEKKPAAPASSGASQADLLSVLSQMTEKKKSEAAPAAETPAPAAPEKRKRKPVPPSLPADMDPKAAPAPFVLDDTAPVSQEPAKTAPRRPARTATTEETTPRGRAATTEETTPRGRGRAATTEETTPRGRAATTEETTPRGRAATTEETTPRGRAATTEETTPRGRAATTEETTPRGRGRAATTEETTPRGRAATTEETTPRGRGRSATTEESTPRRGGGQPVEQGEIHIGNELFARVLDRVNSCPEVEAFRNEVGNLQVIYGESGREYRVEKVLSQEGGEASVLLCVDPEGNKVVAKVFVHAEGKGQHSLQAREKVFNFMQTEAGKKAVLAVTDFGTAVVKGAYHHYFEIMPYCSGGDMLGVKLSFKELLPVIRELNESLHAIHEAGIIHLDMKPDNIYEMADGSIRIGDFGVARSTEAGGRMVTNTAVGTDGYRAPETVLALTAGKAAYVLGGACDYYSLGVTIASLYEGKFVYEDMDPAAITAAVHSGHIPLTFRENAREQKEQELLYHLLDGLVRYTPDDRFDYEDVLSWLDDHEYTGSTSEGLWPKPFRFRGKDLRDSRQVFESLTATAANWEDAKAFLYEGDFKDFFPSFWPEMARTARKLGETYRGANEDYGMFLFLKYLYPAGPIVWRGYTFRSLAELAEKMMNTSTAKAYGEILAQRILSYWLENTAGIDVDEKTLELVKTIEDMAQARPELACYWFGFGFSAAKRMELADKQITNLQGLFDLLFASANSFYNEDWGYKALMDLDLGAKIYGFLAAFGFAERIKKLGSEMGRHKEYDKFDLVLRALETMGEDGKVDMTGFRTFYLEYGPVGPAYHVWKLHRDKKCYLGLTDSGRTILGKIQGATAPKPDSIENCRKRMQSLLEAVEKLEKTMQKNPYLAAAGVYGTSGIVCSNLGGYFCYKLMGREVPAIMGGAVEKN